MMTLIPPPTHLSLHELKELLIRLDAAPKQSLGQNFLTEAHWLQRICEAADLSPDDEVMEIGSGVGNLTRWLAATARRVVAIECDGRFVPFLQDSLAPFATVQVVPGDILALSPASFFTSYSYKIIANIPYYITAAIIRHVLESGCPPSSMVLTVQHEVAQRICAAPGDMSLLALGVQLYGKPRTVTRIASGAFWPRPAVGSAVLRIDIFPSPIVSPELAKGVFRLARAGFGQKRKQIQTALLNGSHLTREAIQDALRDSGIAPTRRAEELSVSEWITLAQTISK